MNLFDFFFTHQYGFNTNKTQIEMNELKLRKQLYQFEISPLKTKQSIEDFKREILFPARIQLLTTRDQIKGFSTEAYLIGAAIYHTSIIYSRKQLLYEMGKHAEIHIRNCLVIGLLSGFIIGYSFSYSISVYLAYRKSLKNVENLIKDYDYFYVNRHEQEFDE